MTLSDQMRELGLTGPASVEDIKRAYRRLALEAHPDKHGGDENARRRFVAISRAYRSLMQAARAVQQGRKIGTCSQCSEFGEVISGADGRPRCVRCILRPEGGRLLPMPPLVVARCAMSVILLAVAVAFLWMALQTDKTGDITRYAATAMIAGFLSLAALAWTCLTIVHCISTREKMLQVSYNAVEQQVVGARRQARKQRRYQSTEGHNQEKEHG